MAKKLSEAKHWELLELQAQTKIIELEREFAEWVSYTLWLRQRYTQRGDIIEKLAMRIYELSETKKKKKP